MHQFSSVQFSRSVMSNSLRPHGRQHTRPPCPSPTPGVHPNPCPLSRWCHPTISSSVIPFSSRPQSFPASGSFPMSQLFASGGQSVGSSASILPMTIQDWFWSWNSNTLATCCKELTHLKREEGDDRGWDGWMASLTQWTWVLVDSGTWWTGRPACCGSWDHKELDTTEWLNWFVDILSLLQWIPWWYWLFH